MMYVMRPIPGFDGYYAGSDGHIYSMRTKRNHPHMVSPKKLKPSPTWAGYVQYGLHVNGRQRFRQGQGLVAAAFIGPRPDGLQVDHKNHIRDDNSASNLRYITCKTNNNSRLPKRGHANIRPRLVLELLGMIEAGRSQLSLAKEYGVSRGTVQGIALGKTWKWLTGVGIKKTDPLWQRVLHNREYALHTNKSVWFRDRIIKQ